MSTHLGNLSIEIIAHTYILPIQVSCRRKSRWSVVVGLRINRREWERREIKGGRERERDSKGGEE